MNLRRWSRNWLLWLALLLPIVQAMAGVHALSHAGDGIAHQVHCDLCLTAANLGAGAPAGQAVPPLAAVAALTLPRLVAAGAPPVADAGLPPARAPPASA